MRTLWRAIAGFFKWTWRLLNFVREFILNLFLVVLILICIGVYVQFSRPATPEQSPKGALIVDLSGTVVDKPSVSNKLSKLGRQLLGTNSNRLKENSLFDVVDAIRQAKGDANITGMVLDLRDFAGADQPSLQYMGKALREFRDSGKQIYATGDSYSQAQYYLASFANKIYLSPQGTVDIHGFATNGLYYKSLLDNLKVSSHVFRVGTYKSAVEPFLRDDMSPAAREADSRWMGELWQNYLNTLAANRQITPDQVFPGAQGLLDALQKTGGDTAEYAKNARLVDELASRSAVDQQLTKVFGWDKEAKDFNGTSIYDYQVKDQQSADGNIAVIMANGAIMDGDETAGTVGGASPNTLTGSIGIFGVINTVENSLGAIGVHTDGVSTSPLADVATTKALPPEVQQMMQLSIENGYKNFLNLVAQARNKTPEQIDQIAQGHVWTGSDAKANGLVDALGDFDDAVAKAAELAKLKQPQLNWYQDDPGMLDMLFSQMDVSIRAALPDVLKVWLPAPVMDTMAAMRDQPGLFDNLNDPQNRYAICLTCGQVK
ncbi:signal peptide peptidase SppA [Erwinia sp. ErVv1]|uniref:signal peptide peptidase SppA n=1 Tax=Erwinia sp. ErVv1 TaxID=1603299 RepID=UPI00083169F1|nr:signal peptide peptidase SppA [Erwinia sp. ErVv1]